MWSDYLLYTCFKAATVKGLLDMIIPAYPARAQTISRVNTSTCFNEAQKCLDESAKPHSKLKAEWLALAECWIKTAEELTS